MANDERLRELEDKYEGFTVYDRDGDKIGKVDDLFVDDSDHEEYIGVKMGLFGLSGTTLIPMEMVRVDERERRIEVSGTKEHVKDAPNYRDDDEVNADFEERIRRHFGMGGGQSSGGRGSYDREAEGVAGGATAGAASTRDDTSRRNRDNDDRYSGAAMGGAEDRDRTDRDRTDRDRTDQYQDRDDRYSGAAMGGAEDRDRTDQDRMDRARTDRDRDDDRYSGAAMGGAEDRDRTDRDRIDQDRGSDDRYSGAPMGGAEDRDRTDRDRMDRDRVSQEGYRNREDMGSESAMGAAGAGSAAPSGGMPDLETSERGREADRNDFDRGDRDRDRDRGVGDDAGSMTRGHREEPGEQGYRDREPSGRGRGEGDAGEYFGAPVGGPDDKEFDDMKDYQSATTGYRPVRGDSRTSSGGAAGGGGRDEGMVEGSRGAETGNQGREAYDRTRVEDLPVGNLPIASPEEVQRGVMGDLPSGSTGEAGREGQRSDREGQRPDREGQGPEDRQQEGTQGEESGTTRVWRRSSRR